MKNTLETLGKVVKQAYNVDLSKFSVSFLSNLLKTRMDETNCHSGKEYLSFLTQNELEGEKFVDSLYISFSEFFRNTLTFSVLEQIVLPTLILQNKNTKQKEIRIWSAACAGGQEVYSLAMIFEELKAQNDRKLKYRIFATDLSEDQLTIAQRGHYAESCLNNVSMKRAQRWFDHEGDYYSVKPELKDNIHFSVFDLLNDQISFPAESIFGDFDLVVCSNLLFYYKTEYQKVILKKSANCISNSGYIVVGEVERNILIRNNFNEVFPYSAIFQNRMRLSTPTP